MVLSIIFPFAFFGFHISKQWDLRATRRGREGTGNSFSANSGLGIVSELCIGAFARGCGGAAEGFERLREKALLYAILTLEKSFNLSADCRFSLVFSANMAERFDFQTLQNCSASFFLFFSPIKQASSCTIHASTLNACHKSANCFPKAWDLKINSADWNINSAAERAEGLQKQTLQPVCP